MKSLFRIGLLVMILGTVLGVMLMNPATPTLAQTTSTGAAWSAIFYSNQDFSGNTAFAQYPNGLNQAWGTQAPRDGFGQTVAGIGEDNFSARFSTTVTFAPGFYDFIVVSDDGVSVRVNGEEIITDLTEGGLRTNSATLQIDAGGSYLIIVDYIEATDNATLQVNWIASTGTPAATVTPRPAATGRVVQVNGLAVRTGPFLGGSLMAVARPTNNYEGNGYPLIARNLQEGLFTWYLIQYDEDTVGWSSGRYLALDGDPSVLPVVNSTEFDDISNPRGTVIGVTRSVMNFRIYPTPRVPRVGLVPQIPWGDRVEIIARTVQGGQDFWYQVAYNPPDDDDDTIYYGWILAAYVGIDRNSDPIDSVPIK